MLAEAVVLGGPTTGLLATVAWMKTNLFRPATPESSSTHQ